MHEFTLTGSNTRLRYHDFPGEGIPILFIHGLGCAGSFDYPEVACQPPLTRHRRILIDLLGSGFSDKPHDFSYTVRDHAEYLLDFVASLDIGCFVLYGHSLGGAVAISLADRCRDRVASLVLSEASLDGGGLTSQAIGAYSEREFLSDGFQATIIQNQQASDDMWVASVSVTSPTALYRVSRSLNAGQSPSWRDMLYSFPWPKTFIFGEASLPNPDRQVLTDHGVHIEVVPHAGHAMAWENPQGLAEAIKNGVECR